MELRRFAMRARKSIWVPGPANPPLLQQLQELLRLRRQNGSSAEVAATYSTLRKASQKAWVSALAQQASFFRAKCLFFKEFSAILQVPAKVQRSDDNREEENEEKIERGEIGEESKMTDWD